MSPDLNLIAAIKQHTLPAYHAELRAACDIQADAFPLLPALVLLVQRAGTQTTTLAELAAACGAARPELHFDRVLEQPVAGGVFTHDAVLRLRLLAEGVPELPCAVDPPCPGCANHAPAYMLLDRPSSNVGRAFCPLRSERGTYVVHIYWRQRPHSRGAGAAARAQPASWVAVPVGWHHGAPLGLSMRSAQMAAAAVVHSFGWNPLKIDLVFDE